MAYIESGGTVPRIWVWKGPNGQSRDVITGQRRVETYRQHLGKQEIEAEVLDISLQEAKRRASTSNRGATVFWLDDYENWDSQIKENQWSLRKAANKLGIPVSSLNLATKIMEILNPESQDLIRKGQKAELAVQDLYEKSSENENLVQQSQKESNKSLESVQDLYDKSSENENLVQKSQKESNKSLASVQDLYKEQGVASK